MGVWRGARNGQMFHGLMGGAIFAQANGIMRHDIDHRNAHQRGQPHCGPGIIGKAHERAGIGPHAAMQRHTVHRRSHPMFADAVIHIPARAGFGHEHAKIGGFCVV